MNRFGKLHRYEDYLTKVAYFGMGIIFVRIYGASSLYSYVLTAIPILGFIFLWLCIGTRKATPTSKELADRIVFLRYQEDHPGKIEATDDDVRRLRKAGEMVSAVGLYNELHGVNFREAMRAVASL